MTSGILSSGDRTACLLKASPKGEGFQPSPSETLIISVLFAERLSQLGLGRVSHERARRFTPDRLVVEAGKSAEATVTIGFADGYKGTPAVVVRGLPEGVSAQIPATEKGGAVKIKFVAAESAKSANVPVTLLVVEPGTATIRKATTHIGMDKAGGERLINSIDQLWLTIKPKPKPKPEPEKGEKK